MRNFCFFFNVCAFPYFSTGFDFSFLSSVQINVLCTDEMYKNLENEDLFCHDMSGERQGYLLPCFCITNDSTALIIWTHTRARRKGFATKLVNLLKIECAHLPLPESINFWKSCNIKMEPEEVKKRGKPEQEEQFWDDINARFPRTKK